METRCNTVQLYSLCYNFTSLRIYSLWIYFNNHQIIELPTWVALHNFKSLINRHNLLTDKFFFLTSWFSFYIPPVYLNWYWFYSYGITSYFYQSVKTRFQFWKIIELKKKKMKEKGRVRKKINLTTFSL